MGAVGGAEPRGWTSYGPAASQAVEWTRPPHHSRPVLVVALHGGYWRARFGLDHLRLFCDALARRGFLTASLEYRRLGEQGGGWPGTLEDVEQGLVSVAAKVIGEASCSGVLLVGHSAGGQLALWAAAQLKSRPLEKLPVLGVVGLAPVTDLVEAARLKLSRGVVSEFLGGTPQQVPERYRFASPVECLPLGVPTILVHGTNDEDVPYALSPAYVARAAACGDDARLLTLEGAGHFDVIEPESRFWPQVTDAIESLL